MSFSQNDSLLRRAYKLFQKIYYKTLGLSPWGDDVNTKDSFSVSYVGSYYNILLIFLMIVFGLCEVFDDSLSHYFPGKLQPLIMEEVLFMTILFASAIPLLYIIRQKRLVDVYNRFHFVDKLLKKCDDYELKYDYANDAIFTIYLLTTWWRIITLSIWYFPTHIVFFENLPTIIGGGVMIQYAILLNMAENRFESINLVISKLGLPKGNAAYPQVFSVTKKVLQRESILYNIDNLKYACLELYNMCNNAADFYGVPILITILCFARSFVFTVYLSIMAILKVQGFTVEWYLVILHLAPIVFLFLVFTSSITTIQNQNSKLAKTITILTDRRIMDDKVVKRLSLFSSDLCNLEINLTACNVIPLDRKLLAITTGTIAMYLVIAVQFGSTPIPN